MPKVPRRSLLAALSAAALVGAAGCCCSPASTGWRFEVGRPATFNSIGLAQQNSGPLQVAPLGTTIPPTVAGLVTTDARPLAAPPGHQMRMAAPPPVTEDCTCEMLLAALRRIESRLAQLPAAPPSRALPKGPGMPDE